MAEETAATGQEISAEPSQEHRGGGPGFVLGVALGTLAGAAVATLFAPATGEELRQRFTEEAGPILKRGEGEGDPEGPQSETPVERVRALVSRVRSRVREAKEEGREAALEAEEASRARYAGLTHSEEPLPQHDE